jgi:transcriptional regulator with XRE-family HTH domain
LTLGQKLLQLRKKNKWSQDELGQKTGLHPKHISRCENDATIPTTETLKKFADAFGVSLDYLLSEDPLTPAPSSATLEDSELLGYFKRVEALPQEQKKVVKEILDAILLKNQVMQSLKPGE